MFYRSDDVWDSAGIDHDQMRRPYRRLQFNTKGDYPVRAWRHKRLVYTSTGRIVHGSGRLCQREVCWLTVHEDVAAPWC